MCLRLLSRGCVCGHVAACNGMFLCRCCPVPAYAVTCPSHLLSTNVCCDVLISISCLQSPLTVSFLRFTYVCSFPTRWLPVFFTVQSISLRLVSSWAVRTLHSSHLICSSRLPAPVPHIICTWTNLTFWTRTTLTLCSWTISHSLLLNHSHSLHMNHSHSLHLYQYHPLLLNHSHSLLLNHSHFLFLKPATL